tara:strand:- start:858 stop:1205 length:348 start_codon:yes stop_codon:yes gene_type:complete
MINKININCKEWFDKINGNSYFSGTITINDKETFLIPFTYGYGSQYEHEAKAILTQFNKISCNYSLRLYSYCKENNIEFISNIKENCKKRELKEIQNNYNNLLTKNKNNETNYKR